MSHPQPKYHTCGRFTCLYPIQTIKDNVVGVTEAGSDTLKQPQCAIHRATCQKGIQRLRNTCIGEDSSPVPNETKLPTRASELRRPLPRSCTVYGTRQDTQPHSTKPGGECFTGQQEPKTQEPLSD